MCQRTQVDAASPACLRRVRTHPPRPGMQACPRPGLGPASGLRSPTRWFFVSVTPIAVPSAVERAKWMFGLPATLEL